VVLICATLFGFIVSLLMRPNPDSVRSRMAQFISPPTEAEDTGESFTTRALGGAEQSLEKTRWWARFKDDLEIARIQVPAIQVVAWTLVATIAVFLVFQSATGSLAIALLAVFTPVGVWLFVQRRLQTQRKRFAQQLAETLTVVSSAMRAGHSLVAALTISVQDAPEPTRREFDRVIVDERLGVSLEDALRKVAVRMNSSELEQVIIVATLQQETGGNTAEVLELVAASIRERIELRGLVDSLTAQGRASRWVLTLLPVGLFLFMSAVNPSYMKPLVGTSTGHLLIAICVAFVITGSLVIKRIVEIKV
jgi:tight adherence protein B